MSVIFSRVLPTLFALAFATCAAVGTPQAYADTERTAGELPFTVPDDPLRLPETALIETTQGPIEIKFYREEAPVSVANFEYLGRKGTYNQVRFHRFVPNFLIQGGDPTGTTKGGPGWTLPAEMTSKIKHLRGAIGWARLPEEVNPERRSNGSQFYITLKAAPGLDGFYTVFAQVIRGMENADKLREGDRIIRVKFPKTVYPPEPTPKADSRPTFELDPELLDPKDRRPSGPPLMDPPL